MKWPGVCKGSAGYPLGRLGLGLDHGSDSSGGLMLVRNRDLFLSMSLILILTLWASSACAEPRAGVMEVRGTIGYSNFLDEGPLHHLVTGGSARFYVTNRIAI